MRSSLDREAAVIASTPASFSSDLDVVVIMAGEALLVLLGKASHGTHEFCAARRSSRSA